MTVSSLANSFAILSISNFEFTPSLKSTSKNLSLILTLLIVISLFKNVGSNSLCCVPLSKNCSPFTLSLSQNGCISLFSEPLLK